jgi:hypothetical protein
MCATYLYVHVCSNKAQRDVREDMIRVYKIFPEQAKMRENMFLHSGTELFFYARIVHILMHTCIYSDMSVCIWNIFAHRPLSNARIVCIYPLNTYIPNRTWTVNLP